mmetsp:Transcript_30695/g.92024  ORF Transcript_30695/g.92024 Transcript_30695/m.92024 type:complete len:117 (+) Transcript_30695:132-482(+)
MVPSSGCVFFARGVGRDPDLGELFWRTSRRAQVTLAFPLPCEDPLAVPRRASTMARDLDGITGFGTREVGPVDFVERLARAAWAGRRVGVAARAGTTRQDPNFCQRVFRNTPGLVS